jgi:ElaB/YqjD/DUF883 family membrane-anchored ribosome-binding protein
MTSDTNSNKIGSTPSDAASDVPGQASKAASAFQNLSADALSKLTDTAQQAAQQATQQAKAAAASLGSEANQQFSGRLSAQIDAGADLVDQVADAARTVADDLDAKAPQLAGMIRNAAHSAEDFAQEVRGRSMAELVDMTSQYARRQPAIFVGAAVASGFLIARFVKSSAQRTSSSGASPKDRSAATIRGPAQDGVNADEFHDA